MESKINKLSMRQIIEEVGFPLMKNEFKNTYKFNANFDMTLQFENELTKIRDINDIEKIICDYEFIFDKEVYIFHLARLLEQDIENIKRTELLGNGKIEHLVFTYDSTGKNKRRFFVNSKNLLKTCDVIDIDIKDKSTEEFEIYSSIDFINDNEFNSNNRKAIAEEKLYKIEGKIGLENVLSNLKNSDLIEICKYSNLAKTLIVNKDKFEKKIKKYIQYMDIEKMLILSNANYFYKYSENFNDISEEEAAKLKKFTLSVDEIIGYDVSPIKTDLFDHDIDFNIIKEKVRSIDLYEKLLHNILNERKDYKEKKEEFKGGHQNEIPKAEYIIKFINEQNKIIVDINNLKETIMKLDENSTHEILYAGGNIFYLPNKECYIIQESNNSFYGNATYIIEKDLFEKQRENIIKENKIDLIEVENLKADNSNHIFKLVHTGWENSLKTFFDIKKEEKYTKEEIENIEKIVYKLKR